MTTNQTEISRKEAIALLWQRGNLRWKLHPLQQRMYDAIKTTEREQIIISSARQIGKSFLMCTVATEVCLQNPNSIVKYVCPRQKQVRTNLKTTMTQLLLDCPPELKPEFKTNDNMYLFPNGSQIQLAGTDNGHHESLRGGRSNLWIVDEAGFCDELKYVVNSILSPTADTTGGKGIIASTPAKEPDHEFNQEFYKPAEFKNELLRYTIYDNPLVTEDRLRKIIERYRGGENHPEFKREYMAEIVYASELSVCPEFTKEIEKEIVTEWVKPPYYDAYTSMDIGFNDFTVILFAYYDFKNAVIVIEDEHVVSGDLVRSDLLAETINSRELEHWTDKLTNEFRAPYIRVADDNNLILLNDLKHQHDVLFVPTRKDNKRAAINNVRLKVASRQIVIHPRCKTLIYHLKNAIWDKKGEKFAKSPDGGHYDSLDALIYLVRNIIETKNPYPHGYGRKHGEDVFMTAYGKPEGKYDNFKNLFIAKKPKKINK